MQGSGDELPAFYCWLSSYSFVTLSKSFRDCLHSSKMGNYNSYLSDGVVEIKLKE